MQMKCQRYEFLVYIGVAKVFLFARSLSVFLVFSCQCLALIQCMVL